MILSLAVLVAGCAEAPPATPTTPSTPSPAPETWTETNASWTFEVRPGGLRGAFGDAVPFVATVRHDGDAPESTLNLGSRWIGGAQPRAVVVDDAARIEGVLYVGLEERLGAGVVDSESGVGFQGPEVLASGVEREVAFEAREDVSDVAPGLSVEVDGTSVRVTFASQRNATTTADEQLRAASGLTLVRTEDGWRLVAFVDRATSDAVAPLPAPTRPRVVAQMDDVPSGEVRVRIVTRLSCFCYEQPEPVVEERVVEVR